MTGEDAPVGHGTELVRIKEQIAGALTEAVPFSEVERHLALLPDRYRRITSPAAAAMHIQMIWAVKTGSGACPRLRHTCTSNELAHSGRDPPGPVSASAGP